MKGGHKGEEEADWAGKGPRGRMGSPAVDLQRLGRGLF